MSDRFFSYLEQWIWRFLGLISCIWFVLIHGTRDINPSWFLPHFFFHFGFRIYRVFVLLLFFVQERYILYKFLCPRACFLTNPNLCNFYDRPVVFSANKTDLHDIIEKLLKVTLSTIIALNKSTKSTIQC